jgi:uncharacterized membrane protein YkoI
MGATLGLRRLLQEITMFTFRNHLMTSLVLAGLLAMPMAQASDKDHERARQAVQAGQVMPLPAVLEKLAVTHPGQVLEVELERERRESNEVWVYEIRLLQTDGQLMKLELDAKTAEVLRSRMRK